jgi:hypothetical protein
MIIRNVMSPCHCTGEISVFCLSHSEFEVAQRNHLPLHLQTNFLFVFFVSWWYFWFQGGYF